MLQGRPRALKLRAIYRTKNSKAWTFLTLRIRHKRSLGLRRMASFTIRAGLLRSHGKVAPIFAGLRISGTFLPVNGIEIRIKPHLRQDCARNSRGMRKAICRELGLRKKAILILGGLRDQALASSQAMKIRHCRVCRLSKTSRMVSST